MKTILLIVLLAASSMACLAPLKPLPPIGCNYNNAVLITVDSTTCYWVFMNCEGY